MSVTINWFVSYLCVLCLHTCVSVSVTVSSPVCTCLHTCVSVSVTVSSPVCTCLHTCVCACSWRSSLSSTCTATSSSRYLARLVTWPTWRRLVSARTPFRVCPSRLAASPNCAFSIFDTTNLTKWVQTTNPGSFVSCHLGCVCFTEQREWRIVACVTCTYTGWANKSKPLLLFQ